LNVYPVEQVQFPFIAPVPKGIELQLMQPMEQTPNEFPLQLLQYPLTVASPINEQALHTPLLKYRN
jgi:hypothetical protein